MELGAGPFTIARDAANGLPESVSDGTVTVTPTFSGYGEMSGLTTTVADTTVSWSATRDDAGQITANTQTIDAVATAYAYTYDALGRLSTVTKDGDLDEEYEYDAQGRRTSEYNVSRGIVPARTYTYDAEDHLLSTVDFVYSYDVDGFLEEKTTSNTPTLTTSYEYSSRGELESVTLPDTTQIDYVNDPLGRRIAKKVNGTTTEKYLWSGNTTLLAVYDNTNTLKARFLYAEGRMPVAMQQSGQTYYLSYDQVGSPRAVLDASGNVVKRIDYDSFGNILADTNPSFSIPFGFAGGLYDPDTNLIRFGARDYDRDTGRWTAKDPIGFAGGDTNLYAYCLDDPINAMDFLGLAVGAPGFLESMIPIWGSGRSAINDFQEGYYVWGTLDTALAVSDVCLVRAIATGVAKGVAGTAVKLGGHSWGATRVWLGKTGLADPGQIIHHWLVPQGSYESLSGPLRDLGRMVFNQPWNLMPMESASLHSSLHNGPPGLSSALRRFWYGTPSWFKSLGGSLTGHTGLGYRYSTGEDPSDTEGTGKIR